MSTVFTFPGQGAQVPNMLHTLPDSPEVAQTLDEAGTVLGTPPFAWDSAQALRSTVAVQLSLLIAGVACARTVEKACGAPDMVLGLSIGAYPAAVSAGVLSFADALRLVRLRGELMERAYPEKHGMTALTGIPLADVERLVAEASRPGEPAYIANLNSPEQTVVAGHDNALARIDAAAVSKYHARKATRVAISVPSHCELLAHQAEQMRSAFESVTLQRPKSVYVSARTARALFDPHKIAEDLAVNMAQQVHWHDAAVHAFERGARLAIEMMPGSVLTSLCKPVFTCNGTAVALAHHSVGDIVALRAKYSE